MFIPILRTEAPDIEIKSIFIPLMTESNNENEIFI